MKRRLIIIALSLIATAGCGGTDCILLPSPAVDVEVRDSITGAPAAQGASGFLRMGLFTEALRGAQAIPNAGDSTALTLRAWGNGPGIYSLEITKSGYRTWLRSNLRVNRGDCGLITVKLTARLQRS